MGEKKMLASLNRVSSLRSRVGPFHFAHFGERRRVVFFLVLLLYTSQSISFAQRIDPKCRVPGELAQRVDAHPSARAYDQLGAYFGQDNNFTCAISAFKTSIRLAPTVPETHYHLGLALLAKGDVQTAASELKVALKLEPSMPNGHMTLGAALNQMNQMDAAIDEFYIALQASPQSVTVLDWLTKSLISEKRFPEAIELLNRAPMDAVLQMNLVMAYSSSGNNDEAIRILTQMIKDQPSSPQPHSALATIYNQQFRYQDAATEFREALRLNPQDDLTRLGYVNALIMTGDVKTALPIMLEYLPQHSNDFQPLYLMGIVERLLGNYKEARDVLVKAIALDPDHYDARYNLGIAYTKLGQPEEARKQLEKALQLNPSSNETHFALAAALRSLGLQNEAQEHLELYRTGMAEKEKNEEVLAKSNQASDYLKAGDVQKAVDAYEEAAQEDPNNAGLVYRLAMTLDRKGDYKAESDALVRVIELDPKFARAHNQVGYLFLQAGRSADAEKEFKTAISLDPHYAEAQNNLGTLYGQRGDDANAEKFFREAIKYDPEYAQAFVNLGVTLASESRLADAEQALKRALQIEPDNKEALDAQAMLVTQLKTTDNPK